MAKISDYTLMPAHMRTPFGTDSFSENRLSLAKPFNFMQDCQVMQIDCSGMGWASADSKARDEWSWKTLLYDLEADPQQALPISNTDVEAYMTELLLANMEASDAPREQYLRLDLKAPASAH
ncbi:hypothetical protein SH580_20625 [Coraliomargarita algicola]|uniref:Uncharacterized protein n=1 Tax=Coraliomargarita algicola TaxID=3092156 RepID=A0ABZ0RL03_9BACT|nr:hypothetical protein [Coraliomargarita sp. J2-16]WPJ95826.1 hypothetical protein SH580_20625 [Coraliomargarita sp. J2-16]